MASILVIDDDELMCRALCAMVLQFGNEATYAQTLDDGLTMVSSGAFDVVFLDVRMPDGNGLEILPKMLEMPVAPEVIIITGKGDRNGAELAIKGGAWDYLQKPIMPEDMEITLTRALQYRKAKSSRKPTVALKRDDIIGSSSQLAQCLDLVADAANCDANVLIVGETGTGKELFARAVHRNSSRASGNFVVVDCAALPENLVESLLFGHEKGAFTGADRTSRGLVGQADGGTLFLDEIGELSLSTQKSFLRVLQERHFRPLGGKQEVSSDFRLVAATNCDLDEMVRTRQFRNDLLFRLRTITIELPPLRARSGDILELALWYIARVCKREGRSTKGISPGFEDMLNCYTWPGNIRELLQALERALATARDAPVLFHRHLPVNIRVHIAQTSLDTSHSSISEKKRDVAPPAAEGPGPFRESRQACLDEFERRYLVELLKEARGSVREACRLAQLSRTRLYVLLKKHDLSASVDQSPPKNGTPVLLL